MEVDKGGQQDGSATPEFGAATEKIKEETKVEASPTPSSGAVTSSMNGPVTETNFKEVVLSTFALPCLILMVAQHSISKVC